MNLIHPFRIQILGAAEVTYLRGLPEDELAPLDRPPVHDRADRDPRRQRRGGAAVPARPVQQASRRALHVAAAVAARGRRAPALPRARARRVDDAARRVPRRARDGRAHHRRLRDRQERARARAHLARQRPRRRRHRRALPHLARHRRGPLPRGAARLPRGARHRRAQHPHDLRRDRGAPAQAPEAHRAPRGPQPRSVLRRSTACRSTRRTRTCCRCPSAR